MERSGAGVRFGAGSGSGSGVGARSESIPLTNGYGSGRPNYLGIWIGNTDFFNRYRKNLSQLTKNYSTCYPKQLSLSSQKYGLGIRDSRSGLRKNLSRILDPGVKKHRILNPDPQHWCRGIIGDERQKEFSNHIPTQGSIFWTKTDIYSPPPLGNLYFFPKKTAWFSRNIADDK